MFPPRKRPFYQYNIELLYVDNCPREGNKKIRLEKDSATILKTQYNIVKETPKQQACPRCLAGESGHFKHV
ncbi:Hypothetical protein SRAE_1000104700 [Strongyloides ratti]|uniref:Uncharacterized protein n=1 Tax=Strongyloides ratti TaxID=34506 RepID=A0A090MVB0_STRRB|nr:Hypothetical protein SRAE_1000104700 [Strongyloides ratti]CEF62778.1 Hypothetical protein SRAE_1000104700 [Strongyloides ratti]